MNVLEIVSLSGSIEWAECDACPSLRPVAQRRMIVGRWAPFNYASFLLKYSLFGTNLRHKRVDCLKS